jgi:hypothetical protein
VCGILVDWGYKLLLKAHSPFPFYAHKNKFATLMHILIFATLLQNLNL